MTDQDSVIAAGFFVGARIDIHMDTLILWQVHPAHEASHQLSAESAIPAQAQVPEATLNRRQ